MKLLNPPSRHTKIIAAFLGVAIVGLLTFALLQAWHPFLTKAEDVTPHQEVSKNEDAIQKAESKTTDPPKQTAPPIPTSSSPACKLFTKSLADQILKASATLNTKDNAVTSETNALQISFCTYIAKERAITLVAYIAKSDVGKSINSVEFGSGRPAGVQNVTTVGQSAFWSDALATMYILKNNNRYSIALTKGNQAETLEAAKIIIPNV